MSRKHKKSTQSPINLSSQQSRKTHRRKLAWLWLGLAALFVVAIAILLLRFQAMPGAGNTPSVLPASVQISPAEAYARYQQGAFILDVRTQDEWNQFHIKGSTLIPLDQLPNRLSEVPKDKDVVVVCLSGHRSQSGTVILQQAGYKNVFCLDGGLTAWKAAGYPLEGNAP